MNSDQNVNRFIPVSHEEMLLVSGGSFWGRVWGGIKNVAGWVKDNVYVDVKNRVVGIKGTW